jgi:hypothetical protein
MVAEGFLSVGKPRTLLSLQNVMPSPRSQPNRRSWCLPGDLVPLRRRFIKDLQLLPGFLDRRPYPGVDPYRAGIYDTYIGWLERHAINPQTGAMSAKGRAFFESFVGQGAM